MLKPIHCIIGIVLVAIIWSSFRGCIEPFERDTSHVYICAGDSILDNSNYVAANRSVVDQLAKRIHVYNVAKDNAQIADVAGQLEGVPSRYETYDNISVILSVGGNDLLEGGDINVVYPKYTMLVKEIMTKTRKGNGKVYLTNLYYPLDSGFRIFYPIISKWNHKLQELINSQIGVVDIASSLKEESDFTHKIEPSEIGGAKIVGSIVDSI
jgi:lysophospholipase L1-like esterase